MKILKFFTIFLLSTSIACAQQKHLILNGNVDDGSLKKFIWRDIYDSSAQVVSDSVERFGHKSIRMQINSGNNIGSKGIRSELSFEWEKNPERWYGFSIYAPSNYLPDPEPEIVSQWHNVADTKLGEQAITPALSLWVQNGHWNLHIMWDTARVTKQGHWMGAVVKDFGAVNLNAWTDWVFHIKFSYKDDGLIEVYHNGIKIFTRKGPNNYNDANLPYWKIGIYKWPFYDHNPAHHKYNQRVLFFSEIKKGDEHATYSDVAPH